MHILSYREIFLKNWVSKPKVFTNYVNVRREKTLKQLRKFMTEPDYDKF